MLGFELGPWLCLGLKLSFVLVLLLKMGLELSFMKEFGWELG